ncbi:MAG TPA: hypothetical protein VM712_14615, partial [Gaiellales bacterium]|nr:hypothetical protein [Gaiellales bacterium]
MARSRRSREQVDIWPGFVDAISTLLLSIIFLLIVFVLGQFFLGQMLQGRTETVQRLQGQVKDLSSQLGLEQDAAADLRRTLARLNSDLGQAFRERDDLKGELARADAERDRLGEQVATMTDQQGRVQRDHHRVVPLPALDAAARRAPRGVALRDHELGQALEPDGDDQEAEPGHAATSGARSSTSSEQNPG